MRGTTRLPTLLLGGFMGTGKSTIGRRVADDARVPFVDLDDAICARAGRSIPQIFSESGEPAFRALEAEELARVLNAPSPQVVALGGGSLVDPRARREALGRARVVTLVASPRTLLERTAAIHRPLLEGASNRAERLEALLAARAAAYAEAHARISTDGVTIEEAAAAVQRAWADGGLVMRLGTRSYGVRITDDPARAAADAVAAVFPTRAFVVTDATVRARWGRPLFDALEARGIGVGAVVELPEGEANKNLATLEMALRAFVEAGADRGAVVVAHGGGVVSDIAGFAAATLLRGVQWVSVPTTLLAMVDASVGGKTGVDLGAAKNAVGAFHQPAGVVVGPIYVTTETERAYVSGLAEVVKAAAIGDPALLEHLEANAPSILARDRAAVEEAVQRAVEVKATIVARDEREAGERALLNFGHTLGHALEAQGGFGRLTHGEAVALGMVAMLRVGVKLGTTDPGAATRVTDLLGRLGLPTDLATEPVAAALELLRFDKKRRGDALRVVLLRTVGSAVVTELPLTEIDGALRSLS